MRKSNDRSNNHIILTEEHPHAGRQMETVIKKKAQIRTLKTIKKRRHNYYQ